MSITVIIPSFNSRETICRAIESVIHQTLEVEEIIVVDDASADGSPDYILDHYKNEPKILVIKQPENGGPSIARNVGIAAARGEWIALLDADDAWEKDRIECISDNLRDNDIVADNILAFDAMAGAISGNFYEKFLPGQVTFEQFVRKERGELSFDYGYLKPFIRRSFLLENHLSYDKRVRQAEDYLFYLECLLLGARFHLCENPGYIYTTWMGGISRKRSPHTKTSPNGDLLAACVLELIAKYPTRISSKERALLDEEAKNLLHSAGAWAFHDAVLRRDYPRIAMLLASKRSAREALRDKFRTLKTRTL